VGIGLIFRHREATQWPWRSSFLIWIASVLPLLAIAAEAASPSHCLTLYGECKYKPGFTHFDYVNPDAPIGGTVKLAEMGSFDSLNPFIVNGVKAPAVFGLFEALMVQSQDEPQSMYPLVAESVTIPDDRAYAEFTINKNARWHDGSSITPEDVAFSFETLKKIADPVYKMLYALIASCEKTGARTVRFTFTEKNNRELPMIAASMPIISKAYYSKVDFEKTTFEPPLGSGPYKVESVDPGRSITYVYNKDYWGWDLPVMRGQYNFERLRYDMYRDENVSLEAFKAGEYDFRQEYVARNWATAYDAPAVKDGRIIKREIKHEIPQGMQAFIFNTRQQKFADRRVREAIALTMDFEWQNKTLFYGQYVRNQSFFENTQCQAKGVAQDDELALLKPFEKELPSALFTEPFKNSETDGSGNNRAPLLKAQKLLDEAGWTVKNGKRLNAKGEQMSVEFLLRQPTMERVIGPMRKNLERLGIVSSIRKVDDSQYQKRIDTADFDIVSIWWNRGVFFPGNEQNALWHSSQADVKGTNNLSGARHTAVDVLLEHLVSAQDEKALYAACRALDRVLLWEHYVIPHWHSNSFRVAYWDKFGQPKIQAKYNLAFQTWWMKKAASD
jgi:microcin C transport system substrate-binding protein